MTKTKGKGQSDSSDWPLFMPVTTYASTHLARAVPAALAGFRAAEVMAELLDHFFTVHRAPYQEITRDAFRGGDSFPWLIHIGLGNRPLLRNGANKFGILIAAANGAFKLPDAHVNDCSHRATKGKGYQHFC